MRDFRSKENILPMKKSKLDRSILCWDSFSSKSDWGSYIVSIAKTVAKKVVTLICFIKFVSSEVAVYLYKSTYSFVWNTLVMSERLFLANAG